MDFCFIFWLECYLSVQLLNAKQVFDTSAIGIQWKARVITLSSLIHLY